MQRDQCIGDALGRSPGPGVFGPMARDRAHANAPANRPLDTNGGMIDAAANDNAGAFQMRVASVGGV